MYLQKTSDNKKVFSVDETQPLLTLSANEIPLASFARIISDKFDIGVVFSQELGSKTITAEIKKTDLKSVLGIISRQINVDVINIGNTYYIGTLRPSDRGLFVRKLYGHTSIELTNVFTPLLSVQGKLFVTENQTLVVADHEAVLKKCSEVCEYLQNLETATYILQLYFVSLRKNNMIDGGLNTKSSGTLSYDLQNNKLKIDDLKLESLFSFNYSNSYADVFASPMVITRDGTLATWSDGDKIPIPKKTISDNGTITTTGFDYIHTGYLLTSKLRKTKNNKINLVMSTELSEVKEYIEGTPSTVSTSFNIDVDLYPNKLYLLGELSLLKDANQLSQILQLNSKASKASIQVWGKVYQIKGQVLQEYPVYSVDSSHKK